MANRTQSSTPYSNRSLSSRNSNSSTSSRLISQRQLSDSHVPTTCFLIFENSNCNSNEIRFWTYRGAHASRHRSYRLFIPQLVRKRQRAADDTFDEFANSVREVLHRIPPNELASYTISVRTGVTYFFSKPFLFKQQYSINTLHDIIQKNIPLTDERYYFQPQRPYPTDEYLRSSFNNVKPISESKEFVQELENFQFVVREPKHIFRIYLQSEDKQTHVCTVDPAAKYSIVEFSKDFQRNSNIGKKKKEKQITYFKENKFDF